MYQTVYMCEINCIVTAITFAHTGASELIGFLDRDFQFNEPKRIKEKMKFADTCAAYTQHATYKHTRVHIECREKGKRKKESNIQTQTEIKYKHCNWFDLTTRLKV